MALVSLSACQIPNLPELINATATTRCGDTNTDPGEACDDGNTSNQDGCTNDCRLATCGDGIRRRDLVSPDEPGFEACDDGNDSDDDACTIRCRTPVCGDGFLRNNLEPSDPGYEQCDDGNNVHGDACTNDCTWARCGDGILRSDLAEGEIGYEACDDGNDFDADGCRIDCALGRCGDGKRREDLGAGSAQPCTVNDNLCPAGESCRAGRCLTNGFEACDDGNEDDLDACGNDCSGARCGDGKIRTDLGAEDDGFEACDDGNQIDTDACLNNCSVARCGDGVVRGDILPGSVGFEACDDANDNSQDACVENCQTAHCGDGFTRQDLLPGSGRACVEGENPPCPEGEHCLANTCTTRAFEGCDDGNPSNLDACSNTCVQVGQFAAFPGTTCKTLLQAGVQRSGPYWIDPDGAGDGDPLRVYCDQETDGGGWTVLLGEQALGEATCGWLQISDDNDLGGDQQLESFIFCDGSEFMWRAPYENHRWPRLTVAPGFAFSDLRGTGSLYANPTGGGAQSYGFPDEDNRRGIVAPRTRAQCSPLGFDQNISFRIPGSNASWAIHPKGSGIEHCNTRNPQIHLTGLWVR